MNKTIHPKGAHILVEAIVTQARRDFFDSSPGTESRKEVERFFASDYFTTLTGLDGNVVLKGLQEEYDKKHKNRRED